MSAPPDIPWPDTLPQSPLADGWEETLPDNVLRTQMEQGPPKLRRRGTAAAGTMRLQFLLDAAGCAALDTFYEETLAHGVRPFLFPHPRRGAVVACRMTQPPEYAALNGGFFRARLTMEVLP